MNMRSRWKRILVRSLAVAGLLALLDGLASALVLDRFARDLLRTARTDAWPFSAPQLELSVGRREKGASDTSPYARLIVRRGTNGVSVFIEYDDHAGAIEAGGALAAVRLPKTGAHFAGGPGGLPATRRALDAAVREHLALTPARRLALAFLAHPFATGIARADGERVLRVGIRGGAAFVRPNGELQSLRATHRDGDRTWSVDLRLRREATELPVERPDAAAATRVPDGELDRSLAAVVDLLSLSQRPVRPEPDGERREGDGRLVVSGGHRRLHLRGDARAIGVQHGRLLGDSVRRLVDRIVFGVGLYYSMEKGRWFLDDARALVERQRPHIDPAYFDEMKGLAEGSGVPLDLIQAANIFPEFFHCSGAALFGRATKDGRLLHARVLDYMTEAGLQDEAVVIATERTGARRFVNVGYAGFIGCVSGMNEAKVAIGEMGGRGEGQWDGTPMSLLVREALETSGTLEEALACFREHKRTCEYYYVVSDGKTRAAAGLKATPEALEVIRPGESHPQLPHAMDDTVLLSAGSRYEELAKRVREHYGRIDAETLVAIVDRPVSMKSNLHNVIFEPEDLALRVADAGRSSPACRQPYRHSRWDELFPPDPGPSATR